ncbi:MAG: MFS transporter [Deltaproteobacteria bacterium]|nr:MFS transporter [Deltaproteobacteria bacterium]
MAVETQPLSSGPSQHPHWRRNSRVLFVSSLLVTIGYTVSFPFLPLMFRELGVRGPLETWVGFAAGGFFTLSFLLTPVWGSLADHYGNKPMVLRSSLGMAALTALLPFAGTWPVFLGLFIAVGAVNGFVASSMTLASTNTPHSKVGKALSIVQLGALLGNTIGPLLGGWLAPRLPEYRQLFWVACGMDLAGGALVWRLIRESAAPRQPLHLNLARDIARLAAIPRLRMLYALFLLQGVVYFGSNPVISVFVIHLFSGAGGGSGATPGGWGASLGVEGWVGLATLSMTVTSALALPVWGHLLGRFNPSALLVVSLGGSGLAILPMVLAATPAQATLIRGVFGLSAGAAVPILLTLIRSHSPPDMSARAISYGSALSMLGVGAGPMLAGLIGPLWGLPVYWALTGAALLAAAGLSGAALGRKP